MISFLFYHVYALIEKNVKQKLNSGKKFFPKTYAIVIY